MSTVVLQSLNVLTAVMDNTNSYVQTPTPDFDTDLLFLPLKCLTLVFSLEFSHAALGVHFSHAPLIGYLDHFVNILIFNLFYTSITLCQDAL